jgi:ribulose 1,5-bisphosphate carboxylase large subunit-like protein
MAPSRAFDQTHDDYILVSQPFCKSAKRMGAVLQCFRAGSAGRGQYREFQRGVQKLAHFP